MLNHLLEEEPLHLLPSAPRPRWNQNGIDDAEGASFRQMLRPILKRQRARSTSFAAESGEAKDVDVLEVMYVSEGELKNSGSR